MKTDNLMVTMDDVRSAGFCVKGLRDWFSTHDLSLDEFMKTGIPVKVFVELGDAYGLAAVSNCLRRYGVSSDGVSSDGE